MLKRAIDSLGWLGWLLAAVLACDAAPPASTPPNIVLYVVAPARADGLGPYGNTHVETPAFAQLASEGTLFESVYAQSSWTRASMASILIALIDAEKRRRPELMSSV